MLPEPEPDKVLELLDTAALRQRLSRALREIDVLRRLLRVAEYADEELPKVRQQEVAPCRR